MPLWAGDHFTLRDRCGDEAGRREVEPGRQDDPPVRLGLALHFPPAAERLPDGLAEVRAGGGDHEPERLRRGALNGVEIMIEHRQRVAIELDREIERTPDVLDGLVGVLANTCRHRVFHDPRSIPDY